ncbi:hypothetical protein D3C81_1560630 [compost metagenome]
MFTLAALSVSPPSLLIRPPRLVKAPSSRRSSTDNALSVPPLLSKVSPSTLALFWPWSRPLVWLMMCATVSPRSVPAKTLPPSLLFSC